MTSPKRKRNMIGYDAAVRALAGMNQDIVNWRNFIQPPTLSTYALVDEVLDQLRLDHIKMRETLLPPIMDPDAPLKEIFLATDHVHDVLANKNVSINIGDVIDESWRGQVGSLTDLSTQLDAAAKFSLGESYLNLATTETIMAGINFDFLKNQFDVPLSSISAIEQSLFDTTASYRALIQSFPDLSAIVKLPSFVLPGATVTLLLAAYALRVLELLDQSENGDSEAEHLIGIVEYLENLDFTALLEQVKPGLVQVYLGARHELEENAPDRARHVLYSLRELSNILIREIAPIEHNLEWLSDHGEEGDWDNNCRPSRRGKIRFISRKINSRTLVDFVDNCIMLSSKLHSFYNRLHKLDPDLSDEQLDAIHYGTVAQLSFLIQVWQTTTQR